MRWSAKRARRRAARRAGRDQFRREDGQWHWTETYELFLDIECEFEETDDLGGLWWRQASTLPFRIVPGWLAEHAEARYDAECLGWALTSVELCPALGIPADTCRSLSTLRFALSLLLTRDDVSNYAAWCLAAAIHGHPEGSWQSCDHYGWYG